MTYNVLDGGQDNLDFSRLDAIVALVAEQHPGVLVVNEAKYWDLDGNRRLHSVEHALGMRGLLAKARTGQHVAMFIDPRLPIHSVDVHTLHFYHAAIHVVSETPSGRRLDLVGTHLCPHSGEHRVGEAQHLVDLTRAHSYVILLGDLNCLDAHADHSASVGRLSLENQVRYRLPGSDDIDTRAIRILEHAGLVDTAFALHGAAAQSTAPTLLNGAGEEFSDMRIDYVFVSPLLLETVTSSEVIKSALSDRSSDHYPSVVDLDLSRVP